MSQNESLTLGQPWYKKLTLLDGLWALAVVAAAIFADIRYGAYMDYYDQGILWGTVVGVIALGWHWRSAQAYTLALGVISVAAVALYGADINRGEDLFLLKYLLSSQSAISWMSALYFMATGAYAIGLLARREAASRTGTQLMWLATLLGMVALMVRWRESYLIDFEFGHIPVSNLYEVFVLFCVITALIYLYYEQRMGERRLGFFASLAVSMGVGFLLWYSFSRGGHEIQPLVPALKSYWMKIHVPANFVGYGAFSIAAMLGIAWLLRARADESGRGFGLRLPDAQLIDDIMYKSVALGFAFFTVATILGALWAAEAWGSYWSWDPKETWALIVWLNYAAWLHFRLVQGWSGRVMAWWALVGFFITAFCFLGVNMFLSGLHSYGEL
ncbi:MAG: c-type cytochrome biogenesis protein CcsB [Pseudomonadota bacterium]